MNTNARKLGLVLFTFSALIMGCQKDDTKPSTAQYSSQKPDPLYADPIENTGPAKPESGKAQWRVTSLQLHTKSINPKDDIDKTMDFEGWTFYFNPNGGVLASKKGAKDVEGKWAFEPDKEHMVIDYGTLMPFKELNNTWHITKQNNRMMSLEDTDNADGVTGTLMFEL